LFARFLAAIEQISETKARSQAEIRGSKRKAEPAAQQWIKVYTEDFMSESSVYTREADSSHDDTIQRERITSPAKKPSYKYFVRHHALSKWLKKDSLNKYEGA